MENSAAKEHPAHKRYPGPDLDVLHSEAVAQLDQSLPDDQKWQQYVTTIRSLCAVYPRWRQRHHWLIFPPPEFADKFPVMPFQHS